ncbi:hypothetical protein N6H18_14420 [Reichenbachiella agarivorans]|uniref:VLRF1 domain-containing protein n=1 Tax=Reichenbachiella agarivorans TaxID=2979464 RepID=A0ABY6CQB6_9BACT|nr:hypothetical protein [Reichenbachiella agarivorans]UXP31543.1 hypothetical protein N6H18_14420 [Reichenbachiella agarivorans]
MPQNNLNLFHVPLEELFDTVKSKFPQYVYDFKKHVVLLNNDLHETEAFIRLPLHMSLEDDLTVKTAEAKVLYVSIESGHAAICVMEGTHNVYHTTFSAYMTRKKQGFSQIKYLKKKGKSRAGSRVRLASTMEFFENINTTLTELLETYRVDRIGINCNATLVPFLHQSKVACPFEKKDQRLYKIPLHIPQSNYTHLHATIKKLMAPVLFYDDENQTRIKLEMGL